MEVVVGAIEWIDNPNTFGIGIVGAAFLSDNPVCGIRFMNGMNNGLFGFNVYFRKEIIFAFFRDFDAIELLRMLKNDITCFTCCSDGDV